MDKHGKLEKESNYWNELAHQGRFAPFIEFSNVAWNASTVQKCMVEIWEKLDELPLHLRKGFWVELFWIDNHSTRATSSSDRRVKIRMKLRVMPFFDYFYAMINQSTQFEFLKSSEIHCTSRVMNRSFHHYLESFDGLFEKRSCLFIDENSLSSKELSKKELTSQSKNELSKRELTLQSNKELTLQKLEMEQLMTSNSNDVFICIKNRNFPSDDRNDDEEDDDDGLNIIPNPLYHTVIMEKESKHENNKQESKTFNLKQESEYEHQKQESKTSNLKQESEHEHQDKTKQLQNSIESDQFMKSEYFWSYVIQLFQDLEELIELPPPEICHYLVFDSTQRPKLYLARNGHARRHR